MDIVEILRVNFLDTYLGVVRLMIVAVFLKIGLEAYRDRGSRKE